MSRVPGRVPTITKVFVDLLDDRQDLDSGLDELDDLRALPTSSTYSHLSVVIWPSRQPERMSRRGAVIADASSTVRFPCHEEPTRLGSAGLRKRSRISSAYFAPRPQAP